MASAHRSRHPKKEANLTKRKRSGITPHPGGHRPQRPCAQRRTRAKQEKVQGAAPGQTKNRPAGGATTSGRTTKQEGRGSPTPTRPEAAGRTPQATHRGKMPRQEPDIATSCASCAKGGDIPVQRQGPGGKGQCKPWQPQQGWKRCKQHCPYMIRSRTRPEEVVPEEHKRQ